MSFTSVVSPSSSLVCPSWELVDPCPDIHAMFQQFSARFFHSSLSQCEVRWSPRMTSCAGVCSYEGRGGLCSIRLSQPLLSLRPRRDLVQTLLHEMIHAYLFVSERNRDHDAHGPHFHEHMHRINKEAGTKITVYHTFHDEVAVYKQHHWRCQGPCRDRAPYRGWVKRASNRAPGPNDLWWAEHQKNCGGTYVKVKEPEGYEKGKRKAKPLASTTNSVNPSVPKKARVNSVKKPASSGAATVGGQKSLTGYFPGTGQVLGTAKVPSSSSTAKEPPSSSSSPTIEPMRTAADLSKGTTVEMRNGELEMVACPVCAQLYFQMDINAHLDRCLGSD